MSQPSLNNPPSKMVNIPYPGRDLAILSLLFTFFIPLLGPFIGWIAARFSLKESDDRGYREIGIQKAAFLISTLMLLIQMLVVLYFAIFTNIFTDILTAPFLEISRSWNS